jgi:hypothetical protein
VLGFKPFKVRGSVDFEASKLYTQWKYMQDALNLEVADGKIAFSAQYYFDLDNLEATTIDNISASIDNLRIKPKSKYKDVLNLEHFLVSGYHGIYILMLLRAMLLLKQSLRLSK